MGYLHTLRLNFPHGGHNEYRLNEHSQLEFCQKDGKWRVLDDDEVQMHLNLGTEVGHWLNTQWTERNRYRAA
jgi:hypothetical protein